jgi:hypothetical protein
VVSPGLFFYVFLSFYLFFDGLVQNKKIVKYKADGHHGESQKIPQKQGIEGITDGPKEQGHVEQGKKQSVHDEFKRNPAVTGIFEKILNKISEFPLESKADSRSVHAKQKCPVFTTFKWG